VLELIQSIIIKCFPVVASGTCLETVAVAERSV